MMNAPEKNAGPVAYLLIESQAAAPPDGTGFRRDAVTQARLGHSVVLFLIQDAVALALPGRSEELEALLEAGGRVWADDFSLAQRGLDGGTLMPSVRRTDMDAVAEAVLDPAVKVVWH
ncbi:DsrH/TusB family sulfur relay protein [Streptomyces sp. SCA3-4]|uniref:DsrE family protein n=1 Tax=Streptomyces sichuanensis TaxID=2871810 RepID=UPI001CE305EB|nr:DsrE family protein [Streptomyces sichuanensis]MCA6094680.1 DsrH/TusB family sulfur relay protein [Streptomyces sichuanensis]